MDPRGGAKYIHVDEEANVDINAEIVDPFKVCFLNFEYDESEMTDALVCVFVARVHSSQRIVFLLYFIVSISGSFSSSLLLFCRSL